MDHSFIPSPIVNTKCAKCHYNELDHSNTATCESCGNTSSCDIFTDMLLCQECIGLEMRAITEHQSIDKQETRLIEHNEILRNDTIIETRMDFFNAATISIVELKATIDANDNIIEKHFELARVLDERYQHLKSVIFEAKETQLKASNEQRAIQVYYNDLSKRLREEERAKFKIADINYQPKVTKPSKPKSISVKKYNKAELRQAAAESGLPEYALQQIVIQRQISVAEAVKIMKELMGS